MKIQYGTDHIIRACLTKEYDISTLEFIHDRFADGSNIRFLNRSVELFIFDEPQFHRKKAEYIRNHLESIGYEHDFVLIEDDYNDTKSGVICAMSREGPF